MQQTLRLILGDQLNENHSWFDSVEPNVTYVMMEIRPESEYVTHHIQKIVGIFCAMRAFCDKMKNKGHNFKYYKINDDTNLHSFEKNIEHLVNEYEIKRVQYLQPDEYRLDQILKSITLDDIDIESFDTEHFLSGRYEVRDMFEGKKTFLMETFYRAMRKKYNILMEEGDPVNGVWNYDKENRKKLPKNHTPPAPFLFERDVSEVTRDIHSACIKYIGNIEKSNFLWPITREEALTLFDYFLDHLLVHFGSFQDSMANEYWSIYHSRISFAMNIKLVSPLEIIKRVESYWKKYIDRIDIAQVEGYIRQILGWREYMRGVYWAHMPSYSSLNYFDNKRKLPKWYWSGDTKMNCLSKSINQSLDYAYAHHIQRLMVTGNFALLAGIDPDEVDEWYLGIYIDAFEWVEITNTRGMSQFADGGIVGTKPYVSSASYIHKMGDYCTQCHYKKEEKVGELACPFNSLYWNFIAEHRPLLSKNPRMSMMYRVWDKYDSETKSEILKTADNYLKNIETL